MTATEGPEIIRLLDADGKVVDSVSVTYEDSFCLDSFGELTRSHAALPLMTKGPDGKLSVPVDPPQNRHFIVARVQTWDHKQPGKAFYSYYNAYHLNKILFQTQVYLGKKLIHRIHVLNPLTNTDIIGNVQYFMVDGTKRTVQLDGDECKIKKSAHLVPAEDERPKGSSSSPVSLAHLRIDTSRPTPSSTSDPLADPARGPTTPLTAWVRRLSRPMSAPAHPHPSGPADTSATPANWTLRTQLVSELGEGEMASTKVMERPTPTDSFRNAARRMSITAATATKNLGTRIVAGSKPLEVFRASGHYSGGGSGGTPNKEEVSAWEKPRSWTMAPRAVSKDGGEASLNPTSPNPRRRNTGGGGGHVVVRDQIVSKAPDAPLVLNAHRVAKSKVTIPTGTVTQFAVPVASEDLPNISPKTPPRRRRALSLSNSAGGPASLQAWAKRQRHAGSPDAIAEEAETSTEGVNGKEKGAAEKWKDDSTAVSATQPALLDAKTMQCYDATLIGTDNDYLESSTTRALFRQHAVSVEDTVLFEMPPFTGVEQADADVPLVVFVDDAVFCESCYPSPERLLSMSPAMQAFHHCKCYILVLLFAFGVIFFILMTLRSPSTSLPEIRTP